MNRIVLTLIGWLSCALAGALVLPAEAAQLPGVFPISAYGLKAGRTAAVRDCATTSGAATFTSTSIAYTQSDVGSLVVCTDPLIAAACVGTIASVAGNVATAVTLSGVDGAYPNSAVSQTTCNATITAGAISVGKDNAAAINNAIVAAGIYGKAQMPCGIFLVQGTTAITVTGSVTLSGCGLNSYTDSLSNGGARLTKGTVILHAGPILTSGGATTVLLGTTNADINNSLIDIGIDGANVPGTVINMTGSFGRISRSSILGANGGNSTGGAAVFSGSGVGMDIEDSNIEQNNIGSCIQFQSGSDAVIDRNFIRGGGLANIRVSSFSDFHLTDNHIWQGFNGGVVSTVPGNHIIVTMSGVKLNFLAAHNTFDSTYGHSIVINVNTGAFLTGLQIINNQFLETPNFPDNTYDVINLNAAGTGKIRQVLIGGNIGNSTTTTNWRSFVNNVGTAGSVQWANVSNNSINNTLLGVTGFTPDIANAPNYYTNYLGTVVSYTAPIGATQSPVFSATPTWDLNLGTVLKPGVMTAAITSITFSNIPPAGTPVSIYLTQNAGGPYNVTWPATAIFPTAWVDASGASKKCLVNFISDGTNLVAIGLNNWHAWNEMDFGSVLAANDPQYYLLSGVRF